MELKSYQQKAIDQLIHFLEILNETQNSEVAYKQYWNEMNVPVGFGGVPPYKNTIKNTPHICFKVPTGGGKTFLACASIKPIFEAMPFTKTKSVVWLVPSNSILEQTVRNLKNTNHPYRQRIDMDFSGRVEVYTKEQLLNGQNFNPTAVNEQLSIFILSYDSLRSNRKDGRKVYQENGSLSQFTKFYNTPNTLIEGIDDTALIQVINQLSPVVIVDESHNAQTGLSVEMLINLNPSFVVDLTATPRSNSNIISYVDAMQLKKENMVKLPVIVYNRQNKQDVLLDAIELRKKLEAQALEEQKITGNYIRPIVLFQAQPKGKENSSTFEKLKEELINIGISAEQIAIKTSETNELKDVDLLSTTCPVRYIITVNALKEGWDCPFAYILATLANKTSKVDVEQILGRILRQPYAQQHKNPFLNMSYVLTSSNDFRETLENIVIGLNKAGFSKNDYRVAEDKSNAATTDTNMNLHLEQVEIQNTNTGEQSEESSTESPEDFLEFDFEKVKEELEQREVEHEGSIGQAQMDGMLISAMTQNEQYNAAVDSLQDKNVELPSTELRDIMSVFTMNESYEGEARGLRLPQFFIKSEPNLFFAEDTVLLSKENLSDGFSLKDKDTEINFDSVNDDVAKVDIEGSSETTPKYAKVSESESKYFKEYFSKLPQESKIKTCKDMIYKQISKIDTVDDKELRSYIDRIISNMSNDQLTTLENSVYTYAARIKKKVLDLQDVYLEKQFEKLIEEGKITCKDNFVLPEKIAPLNNISTISKSLYSAEENVNGFEHQVISELAGLDNIKWWHRIMERKGFCINGFINHYPDFIVMTKSGKLILVETKGDHLENTESKQKVKLGRAWQHQAGQHYRYYMVFQDKDLCLDGAYPFDEFIRIMRNL